MLEYLGVSKRICLYLARISPQQTIDHLVYEISLQLHEEEGAAGSGSSSGAAGLGGGAAAAGLAGAAPLQFADVLVLGAAGRARASKEASTALQLTRTRLLNRMTHLAW
jgi:hypothetical protein